MERVRVYSAMSVAASLVPVWWLSTPSVTSVQLKMLAELSQLYHVDFAQDVTRPILASLAGGGLNLLFSRHPVSWAIKAGVSSIPIIGLPLRVAGGPAILAAYTYQLGRAVTRHYESGGSYVSFDYREFATGFFGSGRTVA
jgi:uncharacterized protein (DUF697 family)